VNKDGGANDGGASLRSALGMLQKRLALVDHQVVCNRRVTAV